MDAEYNQIMRLSHLLHLQLAQDLPSLNYDMDDIRQVNHISTGLTSTCILDMKNKPSLFVKYSDPSHQSDTFRNEHHALLLFLEANIISVPRPLFSSSSLLICEAFQTGTPNTQWHETLGHQLAELHLATRQPQYGLAENNFIGASPQINGWYDSWLAFWREHRLGFQLRLYSNKAGGDDPLLLTGSRLLDGLEQLLTLDEPAVLLHGDLWSGNAAADKNGDPVIFDPAAYYGQREAEFGMMRLFGGFGPRTEAAYQEVWPFEPGYDNRIAVYRLYHELNHLNIFGHSYYAQCLEAMRQLCHFL